jgi:hypothetical protein
MMAGSSRMAARVAEKRRALKQRARAEGVREWTGPRSMPTRESSTACAQKNCAVVFCVSLIELFEITKIAIDRFKNTLIIY